jgi:hypothetical protein
MLSALIPAERGYSALRLVPKLIHQRFVHEGPLVLSVASLRYLRRQQIETNLSHAISSTIPNGLDYTFPTYVGVDVLSFV